VHTRYEAYRTLKPAYYWQMIRGLCPEVVMGRIYTGWREIPAVPHEARLLGRGLDFGFDPDPAALAAVYYHNGGYILDEEAYERRLTNEHLSRVIKLQPQPSAPIVGDSAEPKSIAELRDYGVAVTPCTKGADSVNFGIKHVQSLRISYTARSKNLKNEYENYAWKCRKEHVEEDNHLGIENPSCANHAMSAARYFLTEMVKANADPEADARESQLRLINTQAEREQAHHPKRRDRPEERRLRPLQEPPAGGGAPPGLRPAHCRVEQAGPARQRYRQLPRGGPRHHARVRHAAGHHADRRRQRQQAVRLHPREAFHTPAGDIRAVDSPELIKDLKVQDVIRLTGDSDMLARLNELVVEDWYIRNLLAIGPRSPELAQSIKGQKIEELKRQPLFVKEFNKLLEGYKPLVAIIITGENVDLPGKLQTLSTFISLETDPVRRSYLVERAMRLKGMDVGSLPRSTPDQLAGVKPQSAPAEEPAPAQV
jgi:hypothetical protein